MKLFLFILSVILFSCNAPENNIPTIIVKDTFFEKKIEYNSRNVYDVNHLKQGVWDIKKNGKIKGFQTYKNDTLHGEYSEWFHYPGQYQTGYYYKGNKDRLLKIFDDSFLTAIVKFDKGKQIWMGFTIDSLYPKPIKGFGMVYDSVYVECPFANDTIWYKGLFLHKKPVGIHKVYFRNGKPRFEYNYSTLQIKTFDTLGKFKSEKKDGVKDKSWG